MTDVNVAAMAETFSLAESVDPAHRERPRGQVEAWRTGTGQVLVRRIWADR